MASSLASIKAQSKAKEVSDRRGLERRRDLLILIMRFLCESGYTEAYQKLCAECGLSLEKVEVADNVDLCMVIRDFEEGYREKYGRVPKLTRKVAEESRHGRGGGRGDCGGKGAYGKIGKGGERSMDGRARKLGGVLKSVGNAYGALQEQKGCEEAGGHGEENPVQDVVSEIEVTGFGMGCREDGREQEGETRASACEGAGLKMLKPLPKSLQGELGDLGQSLMREICVESPQVCWGDIAGLDAAKNLLKEAAVMPLMYPQYFTGVLAPWKGILLYGPPGTGKTLLAKAVATECSTTFFNISASSVISKWRGDSEKLVRALFEMAGHYGPSTIFIDEADALMSARGGEGEHEASRRMKTELMVQLDGVIQRNQQVFVLMASNLPWELDAALLRRLEKKIYVPLPCQVAREAILERLLSDRTAPTVSFKEIAIKAEKFSGSDVAILAKEAAMRPLRRLMQSLSVRSPGKGEQQKALEQITVEDMMDALHVSKPSSTQHQAQYNKFNETYGQ